MYIFPVVSGDDCILEVSDPEAGSVSDPKLELPQAVICALNRVEANEGVT